MNVFYFCSNTFAPVLSVSLQSLLESNRTAEQINIYIADDGISEENRRKLEIQAGAFSCKLFFLPMPDPSELFDFSFESRYQMGHSYIRMAIGTVLPKDVERVLCLDCDTVVLDDLSEFWNTELGDNVMAGVADCINLRAYRRQFDLSDDQIYCNAGMFLVDLKKWREQGMEQMICRKIKENNGNVFFFEQTLMNYACRGKIKKMPPRYNVYSLLYAFSYKNCLRFRSPTAFYDENEIKNAKEHPAIVHFTRNFYMSSRPWELGCEHPLSTVYQEIKNRTPFPELSPCSQTKMQRLKRKLWHLLPQTVVAFFAGIAYNRIRPLLWWKNE